MGWILWMLTYFFGSGHEGNIHALVFNPWYVTLCFFIGSIRFYSTN